MIGIGLGLTTLRGGSVFNPADLFGVGDNGAMFTVSPETCFTDTARTTAAGVGDPVAGLTDLSGGGNHGSQGTLANRPILRQSGALYYLEFDGAGDWVAVTTGGLLGETWAHVGGWNSTAGLRFFATSQSFQGAPRQGAAITEWYNSSGSFVSIATVSAGTDHVLTIEQASTVSLSGRANGVTGSTITPADDSAAGNQGLALGSQSTSAGTNGLSGKFWGGVWIDRALTGAERAATEAYFADLAGVTL